MEHRTASGKGYKAGEGEWGRGCGAGRVRLYLFFFVSGGGEEGRLGGGEFGIFEINY